MSRPIGLLQCDNVLDPHHTIAGDYDTLFRTVLEPTGLALKVYAVHQGVWPASLDECAGWVCTGSRHSVYDEYGWIHELIGLVRELHRTERRFVGVCFGHQLIAHALGGRVVPASTGWNIGAHDYDVIAHRRWMVPPAKRLTLIASHQDQVIDPPDGAEVLASSPSCPNAMIQVGEHLLGYQPHIEFPPELSAALMQTRRKLIGEAVVERGLASLERTLDAALLARWTATFLTRGT